MTDKAMKSNQHKILSEITPLNFTISYIEILFSEFYEEEKISYDELRVKLSDSLINFMNFKKEDINKTLGELEK